jgi:hypothetical protein
LDVSGNFIGALAGIEPALLAESDFESVRSGFSEFDIVIYRRINHWNH